MTRTRTRFVVIRRTRAGFYIDACRRTFRWRAEADRVAEKYPGAMVARLIEGRIYQTHTGGAA